MIGILAQGAAFEAVAAERSIDEATRFSGGDLGYAHAGRHAPGLCQRPARRSRPARPSGPFQTEGGWAVLRVEDRRRETPPTLEQARPQIVRYLTYEGVRQLLEQLRGKADVDVLLDEPATPPARLPRLLPPARRSRPEGRRMSRNRPRRPAVSTGQKIEHAIEKALDPCASALKRATQPGCRQSPRLLPPGKPGLADLAPGRALSDHSAHRRRRDRHRAGGLLQARTRRSGGRSASRAARPAPGVFTRHKIGSAPVDWCKRQLDATGAARMCGPWSSTPAAPTPSPARPGADAARRTASEVAKRFGCRQRDVMLASTGVIGVLLDDRRSPPGCTTSRPDGLRRRPSMGRGRSGHHDHRHLPQGVLRRVRDRGVQGPASPASPRVRA